MAERFFQGRRYVNPLVDARRPRPREIARLPEHLRHDLHHPQAREEYILVERYSIEDFFGWTEPLTMAQVEHLVQREAGWSTAILNRPISSNGGIRLHVWAGKLPSPVVHYRESRIRLPILAHAPRAEAYFIEHACAQPEMPEGVVTNKCPLCASQLFGYPMRDHILQECPFADLNAHERLEFMAVNNFAYCVQCGSRSPNHVSPDCNDWPYCTNCGGYGHNHVQDMCDGHPLGLPTPEAKATVDALIERYRLEFYQRIRHNLRHAPLPNRLKYRLHLDHTFTRLFWERAERKDVHGWGPYQDWERRFADAPLSQYANYRRHGQQSQYDTLVVPEFETRKFAKIPEFPEDEHHYLEQIATLVSAIKDRAPRNTLTLPDNPPDTLRRIVAPPPVPPYPPRLPSGNGGSQPTPARQQHAPVQRRLEHATPAHTQRTAASANQSFLDVSGLQNRSWVDIQNEEEQPRLDTTRSSRPSQSLPTQAVQQAVVQQPLRHIRAQNPHNVPSTSSTVVHAASGSTRDEGEGYATSNGLRQSGNLANSGRSSPEDRARSPKQLPLLGYADNEERLIMEEAIALCQAPLPVGYAPARTSFQFEAFALADVELPFFTNALICRIRTLQLILTGQAVLLPGELEEGDLKELIQYALTLQRIGRAISKETVLIVQMENYNPDRITEKAEEGSDVFYIPTFEMYRYEGVKAYLNDLVEDYKRESPSFLNRFGGDARKWASKSLFQTGHADPDLNAELTRLHELRHLPRPTPGRAFVTPKHLLEESLDLTRPIIDCMTLERRIRWMQWMLTGDEPIGFKEKSGSDTLNSYLDILVGVARVALYGRRHNYVFHVSMHDCMRSMANIANDRHNLVFPTFALYKQSRPDNWYAWMDIVLSVTVKTMRDGGHKETCNCHRDI